MNIQLNLLPEARLQKIKNQAKKRRYGAIAGLVVGTTIASIVVFLLLQGFLLGTYQVGQNKIKDLKTSLASTADLEEKATTLQNNLAAFSTTNANRTNASNIFTNLFSATPSSVTITSLSISATGTVTITGNTDSYASVAIYGKSLEEYNVNYKPQPGLDRKPIFTDIKISSVSKNDVTGGVSFSLEFKVDQNLIKQQKG